jgi:uncharacterized membrane protein YoaK (UPF0700 family)
MTSYDSRAIRLAVGLACLAGYVDASGFLGTGGLFVSFMSGNSTRLSIAAAEGRWKAMGLILGLIGVFVLGVVLGSVVARWYSHRHKPAVLLFVLGTLLLAAVLHTFGVASLSTALLVVAMGAENAVFQRDGEVTIGLTYMTGTLVKLGQQVALSFFGGSKLGWVPYASHWLGLVLGAILGALGHEQLRALTLWPAVGGAAALWAYSRTLRPASVSPAA